MIPSRNLLLLFVLSLLALPGCLDIENLYTLNPDGSGRVDVVMTFDLSGLPPEAIPEGESVREFARNLITHSTGIEVWSDLKSVRSDNGTIRVSGRGYFRDLSKVSLDGAYPIGFRLGGSAGARAIESFDLESDITSVESDAPDAVRNDSLLTGADSIAVVAEQTLDIVAGQLDELKILGPEKLAQLGQRVTFVLPGTVDGVNNGFTRDSVNRAVLVISGNRMLAVVDSVRTDEAFRRRYQYAKNFPWSQLLFGDRMPGVSFSPGTKPLFDYGREVAAAKKRLPQLKRELGIR